MLGISIIMSLIMLYVIGRITIPILDPEWQQISRPHYIIIMLAGIVGIAAVGLIAVACVWGYVVGEAVMQQLS